MLNRKKLRGEQESNQKHEEGNELSRSVFVCLFHVVSYSPARVRCDFCAFRAYSIKDFLENKPELLSDYHYVINTVTFFHPTNSFDEYNHGHVPLF